MFYSRNKDSFKKTTTRVEHRQAHKNIINLVREAVERDTLNKLANPNHHQTNENIKKNVEKNFLKPQENILLKERKILDQPINCQRKIKQKLVSHQKVYHLCIEPIENQSKLAYAQKQYVQMLETKIEQLQSQICIQKQKLVQTTHQQTQKRVKQHYEHQCQQLIRFYHRARNQLVIQAVQLIQCKNILLKDQTNIQRIRSINQCICKGEQLLEVYKRNIQDGEGKYSHDRNCIEMDMEQMKNLCNYQEKTINFLRQEKWKVSQFNQIRLLRHEINRVCLQNQQLIQKINKIKCNLTNNQNKSNDTYRIEIQIKNKKIGEFEKEICQLKNVYKELEDRTFSLTYEKQCLGQMLNVAKIKEEQLQKSMESCEKEIVLLKSGKNLQINDSEEITIESLFRELEPYPEYFKLLRQIITKYEYKISSLQQLVSDEREKKQKFAQWSNEVYRLLQSTNLPQQTLSKHKQHLYNVDNRINESKVQNYLREIWSLSIGEHNNEIQSQLEEYILNLRDRNKIIKEVDMQDGSSVAQSEKFTQNDFQ